MDHWGVGLQVVTWYLGCLGLLAEAAATVKRVRDSRDQEGFT